MAVLPDLPVPHRPDHRGPGPVHRDGHHLERPGVRRPRASWRATRSSSRHVSPCSDWLPVGAARAGSVWIRATTSVAAYRSPSHRAHLPGHPAVGRTSVRRIGERSRASHGPHHHPATWSAEVVSTAGLFTIDLRPGAHRASRTVGRSGRRVHRRGRTGSPAARRSPTPPSPSAGSSPTPSPGSRPASRLGFIAAQIVGAPPRTGRSSPRSTRTPLPPPSMSSSLTRRTPITPINGDRT